MNTQRWADDAITGTFKNDKGNAFTRLIKFMSRKILIIIIAAALCIIVLASLSSENLQAVHNIQQEASSSTEAYINKTVIPASEETVDNIKNTVNSWNTEETTQASTSTKEEH